MYAGKAGKAGDDDGLRLEHARFSNPRGICVDPSGNVYVADRDNYIVRRIDAVTGGWDQLPEGGGRACAAVWVWRKG